MKQIYRFMGELEKVKLLRGETVVNETKHADMGRKSTAVGFSFGIGGFQQAKKDLQRLNGIVTPEYLLVGEPNNGFKLDKCTGRYVDYDEWCKQPLVERMLTPIGQEPMKFFEELCCTDYELAAFKDYQMFRIVNPIPTKGNPTEFKLVCWR